MHTFQNAGSTDRRRLRDALSELDVQTLIGPIRYDHRMKGLTYSETVIGGGQWQLDGDELELKVIDNAAYPTVTCNSTYRPGNVTNREARQ